MIQWSDTKPQTRPGRKGFSYYIWDRHGELKKQYCNRIFKSVDDAQDSYYGLVNKRAIPSEYSATIYNVETGKIERTCFLTSFPKVELT